MRTKPLICPQCGKQAICRTKNPSTKQYVYTHYTGNWKGIHQSKVCILDKKDEPSHPAEAMHVDVEFETKMK